MVRHDGSFVRLERMTQIAKQIAKCFPTPVDYHKMVLWVEMNIGLTADKASEYIEKICETHDWVIEDGQIKPEPVD